jgi:hypothetical protein
MRIGVERADEQLHRPSNLSAGMLQLYQSRELPADESDSRDPTWSLTVQGLPMQSWH